MSYRCSVLASDRRMPARTCFGAVSVHDLQEMTVMVESTNSRLRQYW